MTRLAHSTLVGTLLAGSTLVASTALGAHVDCAVAPAQIEGIGDHQIGLIVVDDIPRYVDPRSEISAELLCEAMGISPSPMAASAAPSERRAPEEVIFVLPVPRPPEGDLGGPMAQLEKAQLQDELPMGLGGLEYWTDDREAEEPAPSPAVEVAYEPSEPHSDYYEGPQGEPAPGRIGCEASGGSSSTPIWLAVLFFLPAVRRRWAR